MKHVPVALGSDVALLSYCIRLEKHKNTENMEHGIQAWCCCTISRTVKAPNAGALQKLVEDVLV